MKIQLNGTVTLDSTDNIKGGAKALLNGENNIRNVIESIIGTNSDKVLKEWVKNMLDESNNHKGVEKNFFINSAWEALTANLTAEILKKVIRPEFIS